MERTRARPTVRAWWSKQEKGLVGGAENGQIDDNGCVKQDIEEIL